MPDKPPLRKGFTVVQRVDLALCVSMVVPKVPFLTSTAAMAGHKSNQ